MWKSLTKVFAAQYENEGTNLSWKIMQCFPLRYKCRSTNQSWWMWFGKVWGIKDLVC